MPFWFIGAKIIALRWNMSVSEADAYLLWPEGAIALIAPPFGMLIDHQKWPLRKRLLGASASLACIPLAHLALALLPISPIFSVGLLGVGYACVQNLIWATIALISPAGLINLSGGLIGCAVNVLPMILPTTFGEDGVANLVTLAASGAVGSVAFAGAAFRLSPAPATAGGAMAAHEAPWPADAMEEDEDGGVVEDEEEGALSRKRAGKRASGKRRGVKKGPGRDETEARAGMLSPAVGDEG